MKKLIGAWLVALTTMAFADDISFSWQTPTLKTDGSQLLLEEINGYVIKHTLDGVEQPDIVIDLNTSTGSSIPATVGVHTFSIATSAYDPARLGPFSPEQTVEVVDISDPVYPSLTINITCAPEGCTVEIK